VPTAAGAASLLRVLAILEAEPTPLLIAVAGATDDLRPRGSGRWADNAKLAAARARGAMGVMLPELPVDGSVALHLEILATPPFATDTPEGRARNRTIVLRVSAR
jgi:flagellar motor protein MotB